MRRINRTGQFKRDYKRESKGRSGPTLERDLADVLVALARDEPLAAKYRDHALTDDWGGFRDCRVKPDLVLIYRLIGNDAIELRRLGSHSELRL